MTAAEAIRTAAERLASTSDTARLDAEVLMAFALGVSRSDMLLRHTRDSAPEGFAALIERRAKREPVAYITGEQEFFGLSFVVSPAVLIPRGDSESLVEAALSEVAEPKRVLDLGTGSGALLLSALDCCPSAEGVGLDASEAALKIARENSLRLGMARRSEFLQRDWTRTGWADDLGTFDLLLSNPPYVEEGASLDPDVGQFEPESALYAGPDGLDDYRVLIPQLRKLLCEGGVAVLEIGHTQAGAVSEIAENAGFTTEIRQDLANRPRAVVLR